MNINGGEILLHDSSFIVRIHFRSKLTISSAASAHSAPLLPTGCFASPGRRFVSLTDAAGALDRLFHRIAGEHAEQDRNAVPQVRLHDSHADGPIDVLIVRCFAANDRAQTQHGGISSAAGQLVRRPAEFQTRRAPRPRRSRRSFTPAAFNVETAPSSKLAVIDSLYRETTMA